jgi:phosphate transport system substrate-binding protein
MINEEERALCATNGVEFLQLPVAMDTLAVVVHFDNRWTEHLTLAELKRIWEPAAEGAVTRWNQVRAEWPDQPLVLFGRGQDSGTYDFFTQHVTGAVRSSRMDYTASEDEEYLAEAIAAEPNSLGFFGVGAYHRHWDSLRLVAVDAGNGAVHPSLETARNGTYKPLSRQMYLYVSKSSLTEKPELARFLEHYFTGLERWLHLTGYIPLHEDVYAANRFRIYQVVD